MELRVPLQGNRTAQAELAAARLRRDQADLVSNAARQRIVNDIEATHEAALLVARQLENQRQLVRSQRELLRQARLQAEGGRLSSIELLRRRLDLLLAEEQLITRRASVERAAYTIAFVTGRLATELGVE
jgi:outer membrane protein TolC